MMKYIFTALVSVIIYSSAAQSVNHEEMKPRWDADSLGNHRAILKVTQTIKIAYAKIDWRRNDDQVNKKRIIIQDAKTGQKISNYKTGVFSSESLELWFEPISGEGEYYLYYMPYLNEGKSNYPKGIYLKPENVTSPQWLKTVPRKMDINTYLIGLESVDDFNAYSPMELAATMKETKELVEKFPNESFLIFPEDRSYPIRMKDKIPFRWIQNGPKNNFFSTAYKGEHFALQLGVFALKDISKLHIRFTDLLGQNDVKIPASKISCLNTQGVDYIGNEFRKTIDLSKGMVQSFWCLVDIPTDIPDGRYQGIAVFSDATGIEKQIFIMIRVLPDEPQPISLDQPWLQTRLHWLNSTLAQENTVIRPYIPLQIHHDTLEILGRQLVLDHSGLPSQINTFFSEEMTHLQSQPNLILNGPMTFTCTHTDGNNIPLTNGGFQITNQTAGNISWSALNTNKDVELSISGTLEFDGYLNYEIKLTAKENLNLKDMAFTIPFHPSAAKYIMGLGLIGQTRPDTVNWKWDVLKKNQDGAWIGNVNAGLQFSLRDDQYARPLNTNFYLLKPLILPDSWGNGTQGGIKLITLENEVTVNCYTGQRVVSKGEILYFNIQLMITPFHTINTDFQWENRFYHKFDAPEKIKTSGATVVNIHHANVVNPWINYPFIEHEKLKSYIDSAHQLGLKVKIYNTVRELSNRAYETFPLRSLGHEIYSSGKGKGFSWLQEHLKDDYIAAWFVPHIKDAAIVNSGMSRWHNYYVEGMNWLVKNVGIDGIYLDDVAFDRITMKRIKRVLTADGKPGIIDLHSANQFNKNDGFINSALLYLEHFPYLDRLWFGEYFDYENNSPSFYLTEISGIPFGLMGEMLQDGGNPWRGMIFGMTNRLPWSDQADPRPIWKIWDAFSIQDARMVGWWVTNPPVLTHNDKILASTFIGDNKTLIAIASWAETDTKIKLTIDWTRLNLDPNKVKIIVPEIKNFQSPSIFSIEDEIMIKKNKGILLIIE